MVQGVADHPGEFLDPQPGLVAGLAAADAAGAHADQRDLDAGLAQRDHVGRALGQERSVPARAPGAAGHERWSGRSQCGGRGNGGLGHEIAAIQRGCHDVVLPGSKVQIDASCRFRIGSTTRNDAMRDRAAVPHDHGRLILTRFSPCYHSTRSSRLETASIGCLPSTAGTSGRAAIHERRAWACSRDWSKAWAGSSGLSRRTAAAD